MKKAVKAGAALNLVGKLIDKLFKGLDSMFRDLSEAGLKEKKREEIEEDGIPGMYLMYDALDEDDKSHNIELKLFTSPDKPGKYFMRIQHDDGKDLEEPDKFFTKDQISPFVLEYAQNHGLISLNEAIDVYDNVGMEEDELFQNSKISVTLQRVTAGSEDTINLCAIDAGSDAVKAMSILDAVLADDEFAGRITEEPVSFEIVEMEDEYDVNETQDVDTSKTFEEMLRACVECHHNLQAIHWGAKTNKFHDIHSFVESLIWSIQYNIDQIAEWCVEYTKQVPNVLNYQYSSVDTSQGFDYDTAMNAAKGQLDNYIKVLECYYVNVEHDVQSVMDNWIRDLKKQSNYVLDRSLMPCTGPNCNQREM